MRKLKLYIAVSLDGKIAGKNGEVDWLEQVPNPDSTDYGYQDFLNTIDTTLMGNETYKEVLKLSESFPYSDKTNYVFTRDKSLTEDKNVKFVSEDPLSFVKDLQKKDGKDLWLIGGGQINTLLESAGLIDEYLVFIMPIILGDGIPLFASHPAKQFLRVVKATTYASGVVGLHYKNLQL